VGLADAKRRSQRGRGSTDQTRRCRSPGDEAGRDLVRLRRPARGDVLSG
jgi:hypothetical protein